MDHYRIEQRAAEWLAKRDGTEWTSSDQENLTRWLEESTAHRVAFLRLEAVWERTARAKVFRTALPSGAVPSPREWRSSPFFREHNRRVRFRRTLVGRPARLAAALLLLLGFGLAVGYYLLFRGAPYQEFSTPVGGFSSISLEDGTVVTLNTASRIRVEYKPSLRRVELEEGEVYFAVATNRKRPFLVIAGNRRIRDLGTQFDVKQYPHEFRVMVTEGMVQLRNPANAPKMASSQSSDGTALSLSAGFIATVEDGDVLVQQITNSRMQELLSWRHGYLTFQDTTLADASAQMNLYSKRQIRITDPAVAEIRISGTFHPTHTEAFARLLHEGYSIDVRQEGDVIFLGAR